ncbi:cysteine-rich CWC family protein [Ferruginibacter sp.]|nr:cysteine-rich CWC family protein [Ferruginibacter sp.]
MCMHEAKYCPRCNQSFECKVGNIAQCQCYGIILSAQERAYINSLFNDCVCAACLQQMKNDFINCKHPFILHAKKHH